MRRAFVVLVLAASACTKNTPASAPIETTPPPETCRTVADGPNVVEQQDFLFIPPCLDMRPGQALSIRNTGSVLHNFSVEGASRLDVDVQPGSRHEIENLGLQAGDYKFFCKYHEGRGMTGELRVISG